MATFVDTSALYAVMNSSDGEHDTAKLAWSKLSTRREALLTSNYVILETSALLQRRLGLDALRRFAIEFMPVLTIHWVDEVLHGRALAALLAAERRDLSLVDRVSFDVMRLLGLDIAFAFDAHFLQQGFHTFP